MQKLDSIGIFGYKSIRELCDFPLNNLNVLIGANGSGKSNFISLFRMLAEMADEHLQLYVAKQGGANKLLYFGRKTTEKIEVRFCFDNHSYEFSLIPTLDDQLIIEAEKAFLFDKRHSQLQDNIKQLETVKERLPLDTKGEHLLNKLYLSLEGISKIIASFKQEELPLENKPDDETNAARHESQTEKMEFVLDEASLILKQLDTLNKKISTNKDESQLKNSSGITAEYTLQFISKLRVYHFHDTSESSRIKQTHSINDNLRLQVDAANLAAYLHMLQAKYPDHYQSIVRTIQLMAPYFNNFVLRPDSFGFVKLEWTQIGRPDVVLTGSMLSDGTLRFICLSTLLLQPIELLPITILIDEPELGLHPYAISLLAAMLKQVAEQRQLIVATQSVELINQLNPEDVIVVDQEDEASVFRRFSADELSDWLKDYSLGELWEKNILGGRP